MCGRYSYTQPLDSVKVVIPEDVQVQMDPRYNIAPTQYAPIVPQGDPSQIHMYRWGLVPFWAKDLSIGAKMINARAETLAEKPAFKNALEKSRCLVLADGFYEWKVVGKAKQPYRILLKSEAPFYFAGLSERWKSPEGIDIFTYTIITTEPNTLTAPIHDRMPVMLGEEDSQVWLDMALTGREALVLCRPFDEERMKMYPVSLQVGNVRNDTAELIVPLPA